MMFLKKLLKRFFKVKAPAETKPKPRVVRKPNIWNFKMPEDIIQDSKNSMMRLMTSAAAPYERPRLPIKLITDTGARQNINVNRIPRFTKQFCRKAQAIFAKNGVYIAKVFFPVRQSIAGMDDVIPAVVLVAKKMKLEWQWRYAVKEIYQLLLKEGYPEFEMPAYCRPRRTEMTEKEKLAAAIEEGRERWVDSCCIYIARSPKKEFGYW